MFCTAGMADDGVCSTLDGVLFCFFFAFLLPPDFCLVELLSTVRLFFMRIRENSLDDDDKAIRRVSTWRDVTNSVASPNFHYQVTHSLCSIHTLAIYRRRRDCWFIVYWWMDEWIRRGTSESKSPKVPSQNVTGFFNEQVRLFASYTIIHNNTGDDSLCCVGLLLIIAFVSIARVYIKSRNSDTIYEISIVIFPSGRIGEREEKRIKVKKSYKKFNSIYNTINNSCCCCHEQ